MRPRRPRSEPGIGPVAVGDSCLLGRRRPRSEPGIGPVTRGPVAVVAILVTAAAAACGADPTPRYGAGLEAAVAEALIPDDPDEAAVSCPDFDPPPEEPDADGGPPPTVALVCEATVGGVPVAVEARISGEWVDVSTDAFLVDTAGLEEASAARLSADLGPTTVDCGPDPVLVSVPGASVVCHAYDGAGRAHPFVITVTSETGDWELSLGRPTG